ncbi:MAG: NAD(+) diphosphatase, partial [Dokdonella sp.]|uniref:NAD(+) diphosphatase n=1 Tax=Dokdonella sp. TaxID=2291710 RepID=UPI003265AD77
DHINIFAGAALERNAERRDDVEWGAAQQAHPKARFLLLAAHEPGGHRALVPAAANALRWLDASERSEWAGGLPLTYLGEDESGPLFFVRADGATGERIATSLDATFIDLRAAGMQLHPFQAGVFAYARAIAFWQERTRFCAACGSPLELVALGHRGRCANHEIALEHFPRVDPAMIVIVNWRDKCLLGSQANWPENRWSTLAGFIEPGESIEDAVRREVFEEAGVRVGACAYHSSQPWPFPSSLMLGFTAEAIEPTINVGDELSDARWFGVDELVAGLAGRTIVLPPRLSVSHELIAHWVREKSGLDLADLLSDEPWQKQGA